MLNTEGISVKKAAYTVHTHEKKKTQYALDARKVDQRVGKPGSKPVPYVIPVHVSRDAQFSFILFNVTSVRGLALVLIKAYSRVRPGLV